MPRFWAAGRLTADSVENRLLEPIFIPMGGPKVHA